MKQIEKTPPVAWRMRVLGALFVLALGADQLSKYAVRAAGDSLRITAVPGVIDFVFVRNIGAAFSFGEGHGLAFVALAVAVCAAIVVYFLRADELSKLECVGLSFVCAGAIGNAIDRVAFGFVTDFIATTFVEFPVFNIADIAITCGVALAVFAFVFLSPAAQVDATAELNRRDEERRARKQARRQKGGK